MRIIDPKQIKQESLPLFILSDNLRGFIPWIIKAHSSGQYSHIMTMVRPGYFATQSWVYKEVPVEAYMQPKYRLKFWQYKNMSLEVKEKIYKAVMAKLNLPWYKRRYDPLGVIGQALHIPWLNNPFRDYCSEDVAKYVRLTGLNVPKHPSPSNINAFFKEQPEMEVYGYYCED